MPPPKKKPDNTDNPVEDALLINGSTESDNGSPNKRKVPSRSEQSVQVSIGTLNSINARLAKLERNALNTNRRIEELKLVVDLQKKEIDSLKNGRRNGNVRKRKVSDERPAVSLSNAILENNSMLEQEMKKARPIWQELPIHFKEDVVSYLNIKSRSSLRCCSKADQDLVKRCPIYLDSIMIKSPNSITISKMSYKLSPSQQINFLIQTFEHPKSFVKDFIFKFGKKSREDLNSYLSNWTKKLKEAAGFKIKSNFFAVYDDFKYNVHGDTFLNFLKFFDASDLKTIELSSEVLESTFNEVFETEQWKNLKNFNGFYEKTDLIDHFLHLNKFLIRFIKVLTAEMAWKVIESYLTRSLPLGSSFRIELFPSLNVEEILNRLPVPPKNEPTEIVVGFYYKHTQRFELSNSDYILLVKFSSSAMYGAVCRKTHLNEDFQKSVFHARIDQTNYQN